MDELSSTFTVTLHPAHMFLESLEAMDSRASMIVRNKGYIKVLSTNQDMTVLTSLRMEVSDFESSSTDRRAIKVHLPSWTRNLRPAVVRQMEASFRIYMNDDSPNIFCVVGDDKSPIDLGKALFFKIPFDPTLEFQANAPAVHLRAECFREVLNNFGLKSNFVSVTFKNDSITWSKELDWIEYESEDGDYYVEIPGTIRPSMMLLKWQAGSVEALRRASRMTDEVVISPLPRPNWHFNAFHFLLDEGSHFTIAMRRRDFG